MFNRIITSLSATLFHLGKRDRFLVAHAFEALLVLGAIGSGKTSTIVKLFSQAVLRAGWGGLVACVKPEAADEFCAFAKAAGRSHNVIRFDGSGRWRFNFLTYWMSQAAGQGVASNVAANLTIVLLSANGNAAPAQGGSSEAFWQKAMRESLTHCFSLLWCATGTLSIEGVLRIVQSRPARAEWIDVPPHQPGQTSQSLLVKDAWQWQKDSYMYELIRKAETQPVHPLPAADLLASKVYLTKTLANPDQRVPGNLIATLSADLAPLMQGKLRELFCTTTNVLPEMTHYGSIIVMDFPLKVWGEGGLLAQQIIKLCFQKAAEQRGKKGYPVFILADEGHFVVSSYDAEFQSTARSSRVATLYASQNLPAFYERIGGRNPEHTAGAFVANFNTVVFFANGCNTTRQFAAERVGKKLWLRDGWSENEGVGDGENSGRGTGYSYGGEGGKSGGGNSSRQWGWNRSRNFGRAHNINLVMDYIYQPGHFATLRTGGKPNKRIVDGIVVKTGHIWDATGTPYMPISFMQER